MNVPPNILRECIATAHALGATPDIVQGGGGNFSLKIDSEHMLVKASGCTLKDIDETRGLVLVHYPPVRDHIASLQQPFTAQEEEQSFAVVHEHTTAIGSSSRASMETGFHVLLPRAVIHTHSVYVNILTCAEEGEHIASELSASLDRPILWIRHAPPGFSLALLIIDGLRSYAADHGTAPQIIFLQNHGVVVTADTMNECLTHHTKINEMIRTRFAITAPYPEIHALPADHPEFFNTILFPDQAVYGLESIQNQAMAETLAAYSYIRTQIERAELTLHPLPKSDVEYILAMESEKFRKQQIL